MKNALIEAARVYLFKNVHIPHKRFEVEMSGMLVDFALSLLQWKKIKSEDDLPKAEGWYIVMHQVGSPVPETAWWEELDSDEWERTYCAYIPVPLPEYVKGEKQ